MGLPRIPAHLRIPLQIALAFAILGASYLLLSEELLSSFIRDSRLVLGILTLKGWLFVGVTAGTLFLLSYRAMSRREGAEAALRESEQRFRDLIEHSVIGITITQDGVVVYQNVAQERLLGPLPRPRMLTNLERIHPDDVAEVRRFYAETYADCRGTFDTEFRMQPIGGSGTASGFRWLHCRTSWIDFGRKRALVTYSVDITRSKELEALLRLEDKMASLGRVAAGIAHEIRNPLSGLNIYLDNLEKLTQQGQNADEVVSVIDQLRAVSTKIESVVRGVMDFSKPSEPRFVVAGINEPVEAALKLAAVSLRKGGVTVETSLGTDIPACSLDPQMIEQVMLNLLNNAAEAMKVQERPRQIRVTTGYANGRVRLCVSDSGPGIAREIGRRVFEPFFTTKDSSSGIGLSMCHRIVSDHGGSIDVSVGQLGGAEFRVELPLEKPAE